MTKQLTGGFTPNAGCSHRGVRHERSEDEPPSIAVATALAAYHGEDVTETTTRLYDYVDPDALDALFADKYGGNSRADGRIVFDVGAATVVVRSESVRVYRNH